jgi:hypothetical protein
VIEALIAAGALIVVALIGLWQSTLIRRQNSHQHAMASQERAEQQDSVLLAITLVHEDVKAVRAEIAEHRQDPHAHRRQKAPALHVVSGV